MNVSQDDFEQFSKYILKMIENAPTLENYKQICSFPISKYYNEDILQSIIQKLIMFTTNPLEIDDTCLIANCVSLLLLNCRKEASKQSLLILEVSRKVSSLFMRAITSKSPNYRQLRHVSKMFVGISKSLSADNFQYLVASFVSNFSIYQIDEGFDHMKMRVLQAAVFPLLDRCNKEQIGEVSTALHDSHKQIFQQMYNRYVEEAQYKGKV